jgi:hypothetical protein
MNFKQVLKVEAEPYPFEFEPSKCALLIIDMQRDFLEPAASAKCSATMSHSFAARSSRTGTSLPRGGELVTRCCTLAKGIAGSRRPAAGKKVRGHGKTTIGDPGRWAAS